jgi:hypothetical protein
MKRFFLVQIILMSLLPFILKAQIRILPTPKFMNESGGNIWFGKISIDFDEGTNDSASLIEMENYFGKNLISDTKDGHGLHVVARIIQASEMKTFYTIPIAVKDSIMENNAGYILTSKDNHVQIFANGGTGVFYAVTTLLQLVQKGKSGYALPEITIGDFPSMKMRGISDDISRGQISTMDNFKKIIRFLAMHKMNVYMPYIENLFDFKSYPDFSKGRAPLTPEEVEILDDYGKLYHVQIIPIFETLGHMEDILQKPEFEKYAEFPGAASVNISSDSTYQFMKTLLSEIAPAFSSKYFNMAADESYDVGQGASKHYVDSLGIDMAHAQYYKKIYDVLKSLGKEVMMYGDIILKNPTILSDIPKDITVVDWEYGASFNYPSVQKFKDAGFKFVVSPAIWNFIGPFPNFYTSYANIWNFTREGYEAGAVGVIVSTWNDNGAAELRELNYPGYAWSAECAWNPESASPDSFENVFFKQYFKTDSDLPRIIFELLSATNNQITWYEFWRAPFIQKPDFTIPIRASSIESSIPEVLSLIKKAREACGANEDILDLYALVANIDKYWADKVIGVNKIDNIISDSTITIGEKKARILPITNSLLSSLARIRKDYTQSYLRTNRYPMLHLIESRFDDQRKGLLAGTGETLTNDSTFDQLLSSKFIYYPGSRPYTGGAFKVDSATFTKTTSLSDVPRNDSLQIIGDTYCRLFINGSYVGEVQARRTLTWNVEKERVRVFDISSYLRPGQNTFLVQSSNFDKNGSAGCNIFARIGDDTLKTDSSWKVAKGIIDPVSIYTTKFINAVLYDNGWLISAPKFSMGLKSWIER